MANSRVTRRWRKRNGPGTRADARRRYDDAVKQIDTRDPSRDDDLMKATRAFRAEAAEMPGLPPGLNTLN